MESKGRIIISRFRPKSLSLTPTPVASSFITGAAMRVSTAAAPTDATTPTAAELTIVLTVVVTVEITPAPALVI